MTGLGIARGLLRLRRRRAAVAAPVPRPVPQERPAPRPEAVLTCREAGWLSALAEERARASDGAVAWGTILASELRSVMPDRVGDSDMALVLLHVDRFLGSALESSEDWQDAVMALGDALRFGAAELAAMELAMLATEEAGER